MAETESTSREVPELTVALDVPSARNLADKASVIQDLQFVMDACMRLLDEMAKPEDDRDEVVPLALWSAALAAYGRCFGAGGRPGLTVEDVESLSLQGAVRKFHEWVIGERDRLTQHPADPFDAAKIGAILAPAGQQRQVQGVAVFSASRVLIDVTGVRQLGGLASELAKQTAIKAQEQQDKLLTVARKLDVASLYALPPLYAQPSPADGKP